MIHLMIDGETPDTATTTSFLTLGAVPFSLEEGVLSADLQFYSRCSIASMVEKGFTTSSSTLDWWGLQSKEAQDEAFGGSITIENMMIKFLDYCAELKEEYKEIAIWGNGATFDNVILANTLQKLKLIKPWSYKNDYCYRTLKNLFPEITHTYIGIKHSALDDAKNQAQHAVKILQHLEFMKGNL
jgi:hypothetical protein